MKIAIWSDFACPFCYIGEKRLQRILGGLKIDSDINVEYKAFELDPSAAKDGRSMLDVLMAKYGMSQPQASGMLDNLTALAATEGVQFNLDLAKYCNTFDAHRLMKLAQSTNDQDLVNKLNQSLFAAMFTDGLLISEADVLIKTGEQAGLPVTEIREMLATDKFANEVRSDEMAAAKKGVHAVPYFVFNDKETIQGAVPPEDFKKVILSEMPVAATGSQCDADGCVIK